MMMMSSNTLGNTEFNTVGRAVPPPIKKATLPNDKKEGLTPTPADSFERANPREATPPEVPPTVAPSNIGLMGTILGGVAAATALGTAIFVGLKHGESETALKLAQSTAETAQKEVKILETKISALSEANVDGKIKAGLDAGEQALNGVKTDLEGKITAATQANTALAKKLDTNLESAGKSLESLTNHQVAQDEINTNTAKAIDTLEKDGIEQSRDIVQLRLDHEKLKDIADPRVADKEVSKEVKALFKATENPDDFSETDFAKAVEAYNLDFEKTVASNSFTLIKAGLEHLNPEHPSELNRLYDLLPTAKGNTADPYAKQLNQLKDALIDINTIFKGEETYSTLSMLEETVFDALKAKAQAVVEAAGTNPESVEKVKTAQAELVGLLKKEFGQSRTQKFEAEYGNTAVKEFTAPANATAPHGWVLEHFNPATKSFDEMAEVILTGGLNGTNTNNTHQNADTLATAVLQNLTEALVKKFPVDREGVTLNVELNNLIDTLRNFKRALQPITEDKLEADTYGLFRETSVVDLAELEGISKLRAEMMNARLTGNTAEIERITAEMYTQLRGDLEALKQAESDVIHEVTPPIIEGTDELVDKVLNSTNLEMPTFNSQYRNINTPIEAFVAKMDKDPTQGYNKNTLRTTLVNSIEVFFPPLQGSNGVDINQELRIKAVKILNALLDSQNKTDLTQLEGLKDFTPENKKAIITAFNSALYDILTSEESPVLIESVLIESKMSSVITAICKETNEFFA